MGDIMSELQVQSLVRGLSAQELERLAPLISRMSFPKDTYVFREGQPCRGIYMVNTGRIEISKTTPDGWKQPLLILNRGNFMGEIALLEKTGHGSDALAIESSELFLIPKDTFDDMEQQEPSIMLKIIKNIAVVCGLNIRRMNDKFIKVLVNY